MRVVGSGTEPISIMPEKRQENSKSDIETRTQRRQRPQSNDAESGAVSGMQDSLTLTNRSLAAANVEKEIQLFSTSIIASLVRKDSLSQVSDSLLHCSHSRES